MVGIIALLIGIFGFIKGRINVSAKRELRGAGMYTVATLFCLPLPLSFAVGLVIGAMHVASRTPVDNSTIMAISAVCSWLPLLTGFVLAFVMAKPKEAVTGVPMQGFPVMPPTPPGPQGPIAPGQ